MGEHPNNANGDFYVEQGCCTLCGVPWRFAPTLFAHDDRGCWVSRQPVGPDDEADAEFADDRMLGTSIQRGPLDTWSDVVLGCLGAGVALAIGLGAERHDAQGSRPVDERRPEA